MLAAVRQQRLEGIIAKRKDSLYEAGKRTGSWAKLRINRGQEFVVGGFTPGVHGLDSAIVGYYRGKDLVYVARTRNGFVPATRRSVYEKLKPLITDKCPFVNLPETGKARWGETLDAEKMKKSFGSVPNWSPLSNSWSGPREIGCGIQSLWRSAT